MEVAIAAVEGAEGDNSEQLEWTWKELEARSRNWREAGRAGEDTPEGKTAAAADGARDADLMRNARKNGEIGAGEEGSEGEAKEAEPAIRGAEWLKRDRDLEVGEPWERASGVPSREICAGTLEHGDSVEEKKNAEADESDVSDARDVPAQTADGEGLKEAAKICAALGAIQEGNIEGWADKAFALMQQLRALTASGALKAKGEEDEGKLIGGGMVDMDTANRAHVAGIDLVADDRPLLALDVPEEAVEEAKKGSEKQDALPGGGAEKERRIGAKKRRGAVKKTRGKARDFD